MDDSDVLRQFLDDSRWARIFLPTITHALYISRNPFVDWTSDSETYLATVQRVFNLTFPNVMVMLSLGDDVVDTVNCHGFYQVPSPFLTYFESTGLSTHQVPKVEACQWNPRRCQSFFQQESNRQPATENSGLCALGFEA